MAHRSTKRHIATTAGIFLALVAVFLPSAHSQERGFADGILGRWDLTVTGEEGSYPSWMEIRLRTESSLMASFVGQFGSQRHASSVSFEGGRLEVRIPAQYEKGSELVFTGSLQDGRLSGLTQLEGGAELPWVGEPAPSLIRPAAVDWGNSQDLIASGLDGWTPRFDKHPGCWRLDDGILSATPPCVDLLSRATFDDFQLSLEFRYPAGSNSGVYLRGRYEMQIQDDGDQAIDWLRIGGIYGFIAPSANAARQAGEWQSLAVELIGRRVSVTLNGQAVIVDREIPGITGGALDSDEGSPGPLMLQGDHGPIEFRNIVVTPTR